MDIPILKAENYQRLFRLRGAIPLLFSDVFTAFYRRLDCLIISHEGIWTSYLPREIVKRTLEEGLTIFNREDLFNEYIKDFDQYKKDSIEFLESILNKQKLEKEEVRQVFSTVSGLWNYYSKTEFFYTDSVYTQLENNPSKGLLLNIERFEEVKSSGREYLNRMIFDNGYLPSVIELLSKQFDIDIKELLTFETVEVLGLFDNKKISKEKISQRTSFVQYSCSGELINFYGETARNIVNSFTENSIGGNSVITGIVAHKGKIIGPVKVISSNYYSDFSILEKALREMNDGDVLVAETTSPELMAACKKAGAIITDQGGMLSHAAIVSRELGIPCIVGTNNASEILKDGDMVEVDAEKGIVKILNR